MSKLALSVFVVMLMICMLTFVSAAQSTAQSQHAAAAVEEDEITLAQYMEQLNNVKFDPYNVPDDAASRTIGQIVKEAIRVVPEQSEQYAASVQRVLDVAQANRGIFESVAVAQDAQAVDWGQVINLAKQVWQFIVDNKAVSNYQSYFANVLPKGASSAFELENWSEPQLYSYRIAFKNLYGIKVVELVYTVSFVPGGRLNGKGRYLDRVTILPTSVYVAWGWRFDAKVAVPSITNAGSSSSPNAAAQVELQYKVGGLNSIEKTESFYVRGDGYFKWLNQV